MNITKYKNIKLNSQITNFLIMVSFAIIVMFLMCFNVNNVKADGTIFDSNYAPFGESIKANESGNYGWFSGYDGIFVRICVKVKGCTVSSNSNYIDGLHFFRSNGLSGTVYLSYVQAMSSSISNASGGKFSIKKRISELSDINYLQGSAGSEIKERLEANDYQIIKNLINIEAQASGMSFENFFQKGDFVIVEPISGFRIRRYTANSYDVDTYILGTINVLRTYFKPGGLFGSGGAHPPIIPSCPDSYYNGDRCPPTYWLGPVFTNMLTFRTGEWNNDREPSCQLYTGGVKGCGFFKFNLDGTPPSKPSNPGNPEDEEPTCESEFESIDIYDMDERIELYEEWGYKGLLDMSNTTAEDACGPSSCSKKASTSCLSGSYENKYFDDDDISCFNATYSTSSGGTAYCLESFKLTNDLTSSTFYTKSGRLPIQYLNKTIAATGTLTRKCYIYGGGSLSKPKYSNYVSEVKLDNRTLDYELAEKTSGSWWNVYTGTAKYYLNPIYAKTGTGEVSYSNSAPNNYYKFMGYGVISQFKSKSQYSIQFSLSLGSKFPLSTKSYSSTSCKVIPTQEVVITEDDPKKPDKLRLEFRIIDTNNPFPGKSGNVRIVGTNWRATSNLLTSNSNYSNYVNNDWKKSSLYINHSYAERADNKGFNSYVAYIMDTTNNSYNKNEKGPKYKFLLKPIDLKNIKDYNKNNKYDDFTLTCEKDAVNCESKKFFDAVGIKNLVSNKG